MANHSSILDWRIPWTEKPGRLQSVGLQRVGHDWVTNTHTGMKLDSFGKAAVTKHHKQKWMFSQFWRLKVWASEGLAPFEGCEGTSILLLFPSFWWLPGKFHGQRSLVGYSPWKCKESDTTEWLTHTHTHTHTHGICVFLTYLTLYDRL